MLPIIGITMGDPAGIGPELIVKALRERRVYQKCRPLVIGDAACLEKSVQLCRSPLAVNDIDKISKARYQPGVIDVFNLANVNPAELVMGSGSAMTGRAAVEYIKTAAALALNKKIAAITTTPINKAAINAAGFLFAGHTQLLARLTGVSRYAMMLACEQLKVTLVTTHIGLKDVPGNISGDKVIDTIKITHQGMREYFGLERPRLALCALNPHAGDAGLFGDEETEILTPAVDLCKQEGIDLAGPFPSDSVFVKAVRGDFDAVITLYHDQGLIPIKLLGFGAAVNITLGLPIIRTSVDHGTAFDIAGQNRADAGSLLKALETAVQISNLKSHE